MAMRAVALVSDRELSFETMENPLKPEAYDHMFKATDLELARLSGSEHCLRCIDLHEANPKDECDRLVSEHTQDSRRTATLTLGIAQYQPADGGTRKRRRTGAELGTWFPSADRSGKRINQGYGGDLSFLPASFPVVCKQSTKFMRFTDDMSASWEFSSHKIYPLLHDSLSAQSASILSFEFESADGKNICCTSAQPHGFKAKKVCGQLLSNQYLQSLSMLLDIPLKIMSTPTDYAFTFPTPDKHLQPASLAEITAQLVSGQLQVFFRQTFVVDTTKALYHTMMKSWPETIAPTTLSPSDAEQLQHRVMSQPLEMAPSPPGPSTPRPNPAEPTTPESMQVPSLIVGCSTPADQQQPVVMRQGDLKASGTVTAQSIRVMSDMRLKHNILPLGIDAVDILRQLNIVQYHLNNDPQGPPHIGVLAQDVAQVLADAVEIDTASGLKSVKLDLLLFIVMRTQQQFLQFLPLLTELDKQHRLGLPLLMHRQQQAAQQTPNPDQQMLSATTPSCTDSTDSDSASEVNMLDAGGMECSSNSSGCQQGDQQPSSDPSAPLSFKSDKTMISHILADLGEDNKGMPVVVGKLLGKLGREAVWKTYRQAKCTTLHGADGGKRSPGSTFLHLLKKQEQEANITQGTAEELRRVNGNLHGYQQQLLHVVHQGQNHIIVAPTGSGKTLIPIRAAGALLQRKPAAKILFLSPTVALTEQQTGVFRAADCIPGRVECISSDNPINAKMWPGTLAASTVLVMTAQAFLNMLIDGPATLQAFDLMVFDECHHTQNSHPFNMIASKYRKLSGLEQRNLQVLGLTATPGSDVSMARTEFLLESLKSNLCATYLHVPHDHVEVTQVTGTTQEVTKEVEGRSEDASLAHSLGSVLLQHATTFIVETNAAADSSVVNEVAKPLLDGQSSPRLRGWLAATLDAAPPAAPQLRSLLTLLQGCNTTLDLIKDVGFEMALHYLAGQCLASHQSTAGISTTKQHNTGTEDSQLPFGAADQTAEAQEEAATKLSSAVMRDLSEKVCLLQVALAALRSTGSHAPVNFPKFKQLVTVLQDLQHGKTTSHSIVFVKERKSVHAIVAMLREVPELAPITFFAYTGRANTGSRHGDSTRASGMKLTEQKNALRQFKEAQGMAVLVATAAAEEGIDIINCEMVVCYTVVETGRELAQRRGRARKAGSKFVNIIELEDKTKLDNACLAEANAQVAQLQLSELCL